MCNVSSPGSRLLSVTESAFAPALQQESIVSNIPAREDPLSPLLLQESLDLISLFRDIIDSTQRAALIELARTFAVEQSPKQF